MGKRAQLRFPILFLGAYIGGYFGNVWGGIKSTKNDFLGDGNQLFFILNLGFDQFTGEVENHFFRIFYFYSISVSNYDF